MRLAFLKLPDADAVSGHRLPSLKSPKQSVVLAAHLGLPCERLRRRSNKRKSMDPLGKIFI
jgi:hypothetical protein